MITVSSEARDRIVDLRSNRENEEHELRLFVQDGGCSGKEYGMSLAAPLSGDIEVDCQGLSVFVAADSASLLKGVEIDFTEEEGGNFCFINPNASSSCCCGKSFSE